MNTFTLKNKLKNKRLLRSRKERHALQLNQNYATGVVVSALERTE
jgi:hypothetical protein